MKVSILPRLSVLVLAAAPVGCSANRGGGGDRGVADAPPAVEAMEDLEQALEPAGEAGPASSVGEMQEPVMAASAPSVSGLDRTAWPTLIVHPADGTVRHAPDYLGGRATHTLTELKPAELTVAQRVELALSPAWEGSSLCHALGEPVRLAGQILMLPVHLLTEPPGSRASSPDRSARHAAPVESGAEADEAR